MSRALHILNLFGVLALGVLCGFQWEANRDAQLKIITLVKDRDAKTQALGQEQAAMDGTAADLNDFRARLLTAQAVIQNAATQQSSAAAMLQQLTTQRDQLQAAHDAMKTTLEKWQAALSARDVALTKGQSQLQTLAGERNAAVEKFNELVNKYNGAVAEIKKANEALVKLAQERNEAVRKFNELAVKYNALVSPATSPAPATRP